MDPSLWIRARCGAPARPRADAAVRLCALRARRHVPAPIARGQAATTCAPARRCATLASTPTGRRRRRRRQPTLQPSYPSGPTAPQVSMDAHPEGPVHRRVEPRRLEVSGRHAPLEGVPLRRPRRDALHGTHPDGLAVCHLRLERGRERGACSRRRGDQAERADPRRHPPRHPVARRLPRLPRGRARRACWASPRCSSRPTATRTRRMPSRCPTARWT